MRRLKAALGVMAALAVVISGCSTPVKSGTLKVGVRDDIMNFGYLNETTGKYYGLEIDLANRIAEDLGYEKAEFFTVQPSNRKEMLLEGEVDCLIAAYSIAETRLKNFDFSPAYYKDHSRIMVQKSSMIEEPEDLLGKRIGVLEGADAAPEFAAKMRELGFLPAEGEETPTRPADGGMSFVKLLSYSELDQALEEGTVDAVCMDGCVVRAYMNDDRFILEETLSEEDYGVATQKGSELSGRIAESVQKLLDDGTIDELIDKWD